MKSLIALCLAAGVGFASQTAKAQLVCGDLFARRPIALELSDVDRPRSRIENVALRRHLPALADWLKARDAKTHQRRLDRLLQFDASSAPDQSRLNDRVSQLVIELYGSRGLLGVYSKADLRLKKQALDLVREKVLREGLQALVSFEEPLQRPTALARLRASFLRFRYDGLGRWLMFPIFLPRVNNIQMPEELFEKILWDGYEAHADEFREWVGARQTTVDAYKTFRRVYTPALMITIAAVVYADMRAATVHQVHSKSYEVVQKDEHSLDQTVDGLSQLAVTAPPAIRSYALQTSLELYRAKYHEDPTPAELAAMKEMIAQGL